MQLWGLSCLFILYKTNNNNLRPYFTLIGKNKTKQNQTKLKFIKLHQHETNLL